MPGRSCQGGGPELSQGQEQRLKVISAPERRVWFLGKRARWGVAREASRGWLRKTLLLLLLLFFFQPPPFCCSAMSEFRGTERTDRCTMTRSQFSLQELGSDSSILKGGHPPASRFAKPNTDLLPRLSSNPAFIVSRCRAKSEFPRTERTDRCRMTRSTFSP